jgi:hypothetical protein
MKNGESVDFDAIGIVASFFTQNELPRSKLRGIGDTLTTLRID